MDRVNVRDLILELRKIGNHDALVMLEAESRIRSLKAIQTQDAVGQHAAIVYLKDRSDLFSSHWQMAINASINSKTSGSHSFRLSNESDAEEIVYAMIVLHPDWTSFNVSIDDSIIIVPRLDHHRGDEAAVRGRRGHLTWRGRSERGPVARGGARRSGARSRRRPASSVASGDRLKAADRLYDAAFAILPFIKYLDGGEHDPID
jgi:hypothetical protein